MNANAFMTLSIFLIGSDDQIKIFN